MPGTDDDFLIRDTTIEGECASSSSAAARSASRSRSPWRSSTTSSSSITRRRSATVSRRSTSSSCSAPARAARSSGARASSAPMCCRLHRPRRGQHRRVRVGNRLGSPRTFCFVVARGLPRLRRRTAQGLEQFGIDRIIWPEAQLAEDIERIISAPGAHRRRGVRRRRDPAARVPARSGVARSSDRRIADLHLPHGSLIVAVRRGDSFFIPRGDSVLAPATRRSSWGRRRRCSDVRRRITGSADVRRQRVTIIGGGDVGLRLAERLDGGRRPWTSPSSSATRRVASCWRAGCGTRWC